MKERTMFRGIVVLSFLTVLGEIAAFVAAAYVAYHFVTKYW